MCIRSLVGRDCRIARPVFLGIVLACAVSRSMWAGEGDAASPGEQPSPVEMVDRFLDDSRSAYRIEGKVDWAPGRLQLGPASSIERTLDADAKADVRFQIPAASPAATVGAIWLEFVLANPDTTHVRIGLAYRHKDGRLQGAVTVSHVSGIDQGRSPVVVREQPLPGDVPLDGEWFVGYQHGWIVVRRQDVPVAQGYVGWEDNPILDIRLGCDAGPGVAVSRLAICAPRPRQLTADQQRLRRTAISWAQQGWSQLNGGQFAAMEKSFRQALSIFQEFDQGDSPSTAIAQHGVGIAQYRQGNKEEARQTFLQVLPTETRVFGEAHPWTGYAWRWLGWCCQAREPEEAQRCFEKALQVLQPALGEDHAEVAATLESLGWSQVWQDKHAEAIKSLDAARAIQRRLFRKEHRFADAFKTDSRSNYKVKGEVVWSEGCLTLPAGAAISRDVPLSQRATLITDLRRSDAGVTKTAETVFTFTTLDGLAVSVSLVQQPGADGRSAEVVFSARRGGFIGLLGGTTVQRRVRLESLRGDGRWEVRFRHGAVEVECNGKPIAAGFILNSLSSGLCSVAIEQAQGACRCSRLDIVVRGEPPVSDDALKQDLATAVPTAQMWMQNTAGNADAALRAGERALTMLHQARGKDHGEAVALQGALGAILCQQGRYEAAKDMLTDALQTARDLVGADHPLPANVLFRWGDLNLNLGKYAEARQACEEELRIHSKFYGSDDPHTAAILSNLGSALNGQGQYAEARRHLQDALAISRRVPRPEMRDLAKLLSNLGELCRETADYDAGLEYETEALAICEQHLGLRDSSTFAVHNNLAVLLWAMGRFREAREHMQKAEQIGAATLARDSRPRALALVNTAAFYREAADFSVASVRLTQALEIYRAIGFERHPDMIAALGNLGGVLRDSGDFLGARSSYEQAAKRSEEVLGKHRTTATTYNNLACLLRTQGDTQAAHGYLLRAIEILRAVEPEPQADTAQILGNLAEALAGMGREAEVEPLRKQVLAILERTSGLEHPSVAVALGNLAFSELARQKYDEAEARFTRAHQITRKSFGDRHPETAKTMNNLAHLREVRGDPKGAIESYQKVLDIRQQAFGDTHPDTALAYHNVGVVEMNQGHVASSLEHIQKAFAIRLQLARDLAPVLAEAEALAHLGELLRERDHLLKAASLAGDIPAAYAAVWRSRALVTRALAQRRPQAYGQAGAAEVWDELRAVRAQLARWTLANLPKSQLEKRQQMLAQLTQQKEQLERELGARSARFQADLASQTGDWTTLAAKLPEDVAVVEIIGPTFEHAVVQRERGSYPLTPSYEVFVVRHQAATAGDAVRWLHLGAADLIEAAIQQWRAELTGSASRGLKPVTPAGGPQPDSGTAPGQQLRRLIWDKIEPYLQDCKTVLVVPDGQFTAVPWAALPGADPGTFLLQQYRIAIASHGQEILSLLPEPAHGQRAAEPRLVLVGGVSYDDRTQLAAADRGPAVAPSRRPPQLAQAGRAWGFLPGTEPEVREIAGLWTDKQRISLLDGSGATEAALRASLPRASFAHLATHGYFSPDVADDHPTAVGEWANVSPNAVRDIQPLFTVTGRNPLLLSGIVLAGANVPSATDGDGLPIGDDEILTAEEVAELDLNATELVVLSACETGLGQRMAGGEGVFGLQRAFALAGARTTMSSLWKVDDAATRALMVEFYRNLWERKLGKLDALTAAQRKMLADYDPRQGTFQSRGAEPTDQASTSGSSPFYWGAFVLSGDWR